MPQAFRDRHELVSMSNDFAIIVIKLGVSMSMMLLLCVDLLVQVSSLFTCSSRHFPP